MRNPSALLLLQDGSENDGINVVLLAGALVFALLLCAALYLLVRALRRLRRFWRERS